VGAFASVFGLKKHQIKVFQVFFFQNHLKAPKKHQIDACTIQTQYKLSTKHFVVCAYEGILSR
jgi:hypothetical protein